ncbi:hypothetical protein ACIQAC_16045 [Streptomyces sp. NPDC088387]|uniref:hypothetical protein n=1 Tax=Streptomyces sp. NPDC088387 TaxID=3365859 RepID=UPI00381414CE
MGRDEEVVMRVPTPHSALRRLDVLVGEWEMWLVGQDIGPVRTEFAWLEGGVFLAQRTDLAPGTELPEPWRSQAPFPTVTLTGYDDSADLFTTLYADGRGVARTYSTSVSDGVWRQWRAAPGFHQRFTADIDTTHRIVKGRWERSGDGEEWATDFDVTYTRVGAPRPS